MRRNNAAENTSLGEKCPSWCHGGKEKMTVMEVVEAYGGSD